MRKRVSYLNEKNSNHKYIKHFNPDISVLDKECRDLFEFNAGEGNENFNDFLFGVNIFDKNNNYHTDKIYIHQLERDHLDYVARQLEFLSKLQLVSITEANQNTPNDAPQPQ